MKCSLFLSSSSNPGLTYLIIYVKWFDQTRVLFLLYLLKDWDRQLQAEVRTHISARRAYCNLVTKWLFQTQAFKIGRRVFPVTSVCLSANQNFPWKLSVQFSRSVMSDSLRPHELQHARPPCPSPTPGVHPDSCPSSRWCHPAISSSVSGDIFLCLIGQRCVLHL